MKKTNFTKAYEHLKTLTQEELKELVIKLLEENEKLKNDILIDELTNIYNRKVLNKNLHYDVLAMCDIDNFKAINDSFGHQVGDELLKEIAKKLSEILRSEDLLLRYGGDEFTILFKNCSIEDIKNKLDKFKGNGLYNDKLNIKVTMSFGITEYTEGKDLDEAISEADSALYKSKQKGKNAVTIYQKDSVKKLEKIQTNKETI